MNAVHSGHSMQWTEWNSGIWWWGHCLWCKKVKPVDTVHSEHSMQWVQYTGDAVHSEHSGIMVYGGGNIVFWCEKVKPVDAVE